MDGVCGDDDARAFADGDLSASGYLVGEAPFEAEYQLHVRMLVWLHRHRPRRIPLRDAREPTKSDVILPEPVADIIVSVVSHLKYYTRILGRRVAENSPLYDFLRGMW